MSDFITRLLDERDGLSDKIKNLSSFIGTEPFSKLDETNQNLLFEQEIAMIKYLTILIQRIEHLTKGNS